MKQSPSSTLEPPLIYRNIWSVDTSNSIDERQRRYFTTSYMETTKDEEIKKLLKRMCDLLETRARKEEQLCREAEKQRYNDEKENDMKNDWMLAAAVLDRICAIAVTIFFVVGTIVFFVLFVHHPWPLFYVQMLFGFKKKLSCFHIVYT